MPTIFRGGRLRCVGDGLHVLAKLYWVIASGWDLRGILFRVSNYWSGVHWVFVVRDYRRVWGWWVDDGPCAHKIHFGNAKHSLSLSSLTQSFLFNQVLFLLPFSSWMLSGYFVAIFGPQPDIGLFPKEQPMSNQQTLYTFFTFFLNSDKPRRTKILSWSIHQLTQTHASLPTLSF